MRIILFADIRTLDIVLGLSAALTELKNESKKAEEKEKTDYDFGLSLTNFDLVYLARVKTNRTTSDDNNKTGAQR